MNLRRAGFLLSTFASAVRMDVLRSILLKPVTLKQKIERRMFRRGLQATIDAKPRRRQNAPGKINQTAKIPKIENTAAGSNLYHIEDNLLPHAFCVKLLLVLLYRLRPTGFLVRTCK